jgi:hypothetical protein
VRLQRRLLSRGGRALFLNLVVVGAGGLLAAALSRSAAGRLSEADYGSAQVADARRTAPLGALSQQAAGTRT